MAEYGLQAIAPSACTKGAEAGAGQDEAMTVKRATLRDVAKLAGVTPSTVSRLLNGKPLPVAVTERTRQRVLEAAKTLQYRPNRLARGLTAAQTHVIGMSFPMTEPLKRTDHREVTWLNFGMLVSGVQTVTQSRGYELHIVNRVEHHYDPEAPPPRMCLDFIDGLIYVEPNPGYRYFDELAEQGTPMVMLGPNPMNRPCHSVCPDNRREMHDLVAALLRKGHRRVAFLVGTPNEPPQDVLLRIEGYRQAHDEAGVPVDLNLLRLDFVGDIPLRQVIERMLDAQPTAVLVGRPELALDTLKAVNDRRLQSPYDVEILVIGDDRAFEMFKPRVSATRFSYLELGAAAAKLLVDVVEGRVETPQQVAVPWSLVERETCILGDAYQGPRCDPYGAERRVLEAFNSAALERR